MGWAADRNLSWGTDIIFPYGPASPLVTLYGNANYLRLTLPLLLAVSGLLAACAVLLVRAGETGMKRGFGITMVAAVLTLGLTASGIAGNLDSLFLVLPLFPTLLVLTPGPFSSSFIGVAMVTAAVVGAVGTAKAGFPIAAFPVFLVGDAACLVRRRPPILTLAFIVGFLVSDLAYGQHLANLPAFLYGEAQVVAGYGEAMASYGSRGELVAFLCSSIFLLTLLGLAEWRTDTAAGRSPLALPIAFGITTAMLFKAGFVRQDLHTLIAWEGLALAAAILAWSRLRQWRRDIALAVLCFAVVGALALRPWIETEDVASANRVAAVLSFEHSRLIADPLDQLAAAWDLALQPREFADRLQAAEVNRWQELAALGPLPRLAGTVDTIPSIQSQILANGLDYRPRPNFQEYATYTPEGLAANRAFLMRPGAPNWMIFGAEPGFGSLTIDNRYSNLAEGPLWLDLLRLYKPQCSIDTFVALQRRDVPVDLKLSDIRYTSAGFDEIIHVPSTLSATGTFARIDARPTLLGRIAALVFKPAPLFITVDFADEHQQTYRFIGSIGEAGFVLSPLVRTGIEFVELAQGRAPPGDRRVVAFQIHVPPRLRGFFAPEISIQMQSIDVERQFAVTDLSTPSNVIDDTLSICSPPA